MTDDDGGTDMPFYNVLVPVTTVRGVVVEADSEAEALFEAMRDEWGDHVVMELGDEFLSVDAGSAVVVEDEDGWDDSYVPEGDTPLTDYGIDLTPFRG